MDAQKTRRRARSFAVSENDTAGDLLVAVTEKQRIVAASDNGEAAWYP